MSPKAWSEELEKGKENAKHWTHPRQMPCGKQATTTYRIFTQTHTKLRGTQTHSTDLHFCEECDPKTNNPHTVKKISYKSIWGNPTSVSQLDEVSSIEEERVLEVTEGLVSWMSTKRRSGLSKEDWMRACEQAWEIFSVNQVLNG
jgi:hypothetical protein